MTREATSSDIRTTWRRFFQERSRARLGEVLTVLAQRHGHPFKGEHRRYCAVRSGRDCCRWQSEPRTDQAMQGTTRTTLWQPKENATQLPFVRRAQKPWGSRVRLWPPVTGQWWNKYKGGDPRTDQAKKGTTRTPGWQPKENATSLPRQEALSNQCGYCTEGRGPKDPSA